MTLVKKVVAQLPLGWQQELRRQKFRRAIQRGDFHPGEPEFDKLKDWIQPGDWVLDVGANIGCYTIEMSRLVGSEGRVVAFEPIPETFALLAGNLDFAGCSNVTLINAAVSNTVRSAQMNIPKFGSGLENFYMARLGSFKDDTSVRACHVLTLTLDKIGIENRIALAKIDAEGHERFVLEGMWALIERDRPRLILETSSSAIHDKLLGLGYALEKISGSPNRVYCAETP